MKSFRLRTRPTSTEGARSDVGGELTHERQYNTTITEYATRSSVILF